MPADALAPCVARSSAAMVLAMRNGQVLVFHEEGFQLPVSCQCRGLTEDVNMFLFPLRNLARNGLICIYSLIYLSIYDYLLSKDRSGRRVTNKRVDVVPAK